MGESGRGVDMADWRAEDEEGEGGEGGLAGALLLAAFGVWNLALKLNRRLLLLLP